MCVLAIKSSSSFSECCFEKFGIYIQKLAGQVWISTFLPPCFQWQKKPKTSTLIQMESHLLFLLHCKQYYIFVAGKEWFQKAKMCFVMKVYNLCSFVYILKFLSIYLSHLAVNQPDLRFPDHLHHKQLITQLRSGPLWLDNFSWNINETQGEIRSSSERRIG